MTAFEAFLLLVTLASLGACLYLGRLVKAQDKVFALSIAQKDEELDSTTRRLDQMIGLSERLSDGKSKLESELAMARRALIVQLLRQVDSDD